MLHAPLSGDPDPDLEQSIEDFLRPAADMQAMLETSERLKSGSPARRQALDYVQSIRADIALRADRHRLSEVEFSSLLYAELAARRSRRRAKPAATPASITPEHDAALALEAEALRALKAARQVYADAKASRIALEAQQAAERVSL